MLPISGRVHVVSPGAGLATPSAAQASAPQAVDPNVHPVPRRLRDWLSIGAISCQRCPPAPLFLPCRRFTTTTQGSRFEALVDFTLLPLNSLSSKVRHPHHNVRRRAENVGPRHGPRFRFPAATTVGLTSRVSTQPAFPGFEGYVSGRCDELGTESLCGLPRLCTWTDDTRPSGRRHFVTIDGAQAVD